MKTTEETKEKTLGIEDLSGEVNELENEFLTIVWQSGKAEEISDLEA